MNFSYYIYINDKLLAIAYSQTMCEMIVSAIYDEYPTEHFVKITIDRRYESTEAESKINDKETI